MNQSWLMAKSQKLSGKVQIIKFSITYIWEDWYSRKRKTGSSNSGFSASFAPPALKLVTLCNSCHWHLHLQRSLNVTATFRLLYLSRSTKLLNQCLMNLAQLSFLEQNLSSPVGCLEQDLNWQLQLHFIRFWQHLESSDMNLRGDCRSMPSWG